MMLARPFTAEFVIASPSRGPAVALLVDEAAL
jgi:hypothetical protein